MQKTGKSSSKEERFDCKLKSLQAKKSYGNLFHLWPKNSVNKRIAVTGVFLGLVLLFQYLEQFMPYGTTFLNFNFSLLFILPIFYFSGPFFGVLTLFLRFAIGPAFALGYTTYNLVDHFVLFCCTVVCIGFMYLFTVLFNRWTKSRNVELVLISTCTVLCTSAFLTFLNGVFFTPLYAYVYGVTNNLSLSELISNFNVEIHVYEEDGKTISYSYRYSDYFFGIKNYWFAIFVLYLPFNLIKFTLIYVVYFPLSKVFWIYSQKIN